MDTSEIEKIVISKIASQFRIEPDELDLSTNFVKELGVDSLDTVELIMMLEDEFDFDIKDEEAEALLTVQSVVDFVVRELNEF